MNKWSYRLANGHSIRRKTLHDKWYPSRFSYKKFSFSKIATHSLPSPLKHSKTTFFYSETHWILICSAETTLFPNISEYTPVIILKYFFTCTSCDNGELDTLIYFHRYSTKFTLIDRICFESKVNVLNVMLCSVIKCNFRLIFHKIYRNIVVIL